MGSRLGWASADAELTNYRAALARTYGGTVNHL